MQRLDPPPSHVNILQVLLAAQEPSGYLSPAALSRLEQDFGISRSAAESVASFYAFLHLAPVGEYRILFSDNITDRMLGNLELLERLCSKLWIERGKVSEDGLVSVDTTSCTGLCDQGPALLVNGRAIARASAERVDRIAELVRARLPLSAWPAEFFRIDDHIRRKDVLLDAAYSPGSAVRAAMSQGPERLIESIKTAKLRGRGGAGFGTGLKWDACRSAPGEQRYVVCNADEGEPGTFKDRVLLTTYADHVFEGMTVCAHAVGARQGFVYLRGEYRYLLEPLRAVLERRRQQGLLGRDVLGSAGFDFDIEVRLGAGAYICGEESALIESLEGKRGIPRNRPPFPVTHGYLNQPTVVNNVETFAAAALIALHGDEWFAGLGTAESAGTKLLSVSGDCARPGIYEYPFGVTVREVLADCGAACTQAVQISGPSGICVAASEFERRIAFEDLPTAGAFMIFDASRDLFEVARNFVQFFAHESCGFCTPCRVGTSLLWNLMDKLHDGRGSPYDLEAVQKLNGLLQSMSHCGLGHGACNPVLDTIAKFRPAYEQRLLHADYAPAFDLDAALAPARWTTGRDDPDAHLETAV